MNIVIISQYSGSSLHGMVYRNHALAREWVRSGHHVTIVASEFSHTRRIQPLGPGQDDIEGVRFIWTADRPYRQTQKYRRVVSMLRFVYGVYALRESLADCADIVIVSSPQPLVIYPARALAKTAAAPLVYDIRDIWPLSLVEIGGLSHRSPFVWLLRQAERYAHHWADLITAAPSKITAYLTRDGVSPEDILHVPNPADTSLRTDVSLPNFLVAKLAQLKVDQRFIVAYAGALGEANAMESAVRSLQLVRGPVHLLVVGHGSQREKLIQIARETGVDDRISFFSGLTRHQVHALLAEVDAAYAGVKNLHLYTYGASLTKLNDYMQAGTPIIYSSPEMDSQVKRARCGLECAAENPVAIAACIDEMIALDVPYRRMLGQRGLQWIAENQSVDVVAAAMLTRMEKLVAGHSGSR